MDNVIKSIGVIIRRMNRIVSEIKSVANDAMTAATEAKDIASSIDSKIIVKSSTEGSSKRFKITVDDSGVISATEVTE